MFTVLATGSRDWNDEAPVRNVLVSIDAERHDEVIHLIHGDARGLDQMAGKIAEELHWKVTAVPADWERYGRNAGPIRNLLMVNMKPDFVIAFPLAKTGGTWHCIKAAMQAHLTVAVYDKDGLLQ